MTPCPYVSIFGFVCTISPRTNLAGALRQDGYDVQAGKLRSTMPQELDLAAADDDVHQILRELKLNTTLGHLENAIAAHSRGEWAGANGQLRTFFESLLADFAQKLAPEAFAAATKDHAKREVLAKTTPPFLDPDLNEWILGVGEQWNEKSGKAI